MCSLGIEPSTFCTANALLYHWATGTQSVVLCRTVRGSKTDIVTVLGPKIGYDTAWPSHSVFAGVIHIYGPTNKNLTWNQHDMVLKQKTAYLKLISLPLHRFHFFSAHLKTTNAWVWLSCSFCLPQAHADDVLFFYSNVHRSIQVNRCHHRTVYIHVVVKFIRSMAHSVTCNDLIGLIKLCRVSRAIESVQTQCNNKLCHVILHWKAEDVWENNLVRPF